MRSPSALIGLDADQEDSRPPVPPSPSRFSCETEYVTVGQTYTPDPNTWPEQVAIYVSVAMDRLGSLRGSLSRGELVEAALEATGVPSKEQPMLDNMRRIEANFLAGEALGQLVADGLAWAVSKGDPGLGEMWTRLGFDKSGSWGIDSPDRVRPTVRLLSLDPATWVTPRSWEAVDELALEAQGAYRAGYGVAAAAAARVTAEQTVEEALAAVAPDDGWRSLRAAAREAELFGLLRPKDFRGGPLDMTDTQATLSAARHQGNHAAHEGKVPHPGVQALVSALLPQALASIHAAGTGSR